MGVCGLEIPRWRYLSAASHQLVHPLILLLPTTPSNPYPRLLPPLKHSYIPRLPIYPPGVKHDADGRLDKDHPRTKL